MKILNRKDKKNEGEAEAYFLLTFGSQNQTCDIY